MQPQALSVKLHLRDGTDGSTVRPSVS